MNNTSGELAKGNIMPSVKPQTTPVDHLRCQSSNVNKVFKSGPLFLSSKGIGWTSWKKRWFVLTQTSLVFFRSDPSVVFEKGNEVNLTLGGIDLNNSGSVDVKEDKKLLIVQFPDERDGREFTLKAETTVDLYEWKTALENVLAHAPSVIDLMGQDGIFRSSQADSLDNHLGQLKERETVKHAVLGRPILLALEEVDGTPTFLEKALRFIEEHGVRVEGILRQAADVEDVERRVREYEQGKNEFSKEEDAHVIGDCIKYVIRELPSSPVPASCCKALLEACRTARANRVSAMRAAIWDTFPEPNRRLLQRILLMMQTIASNKAENRMSPSAVAACMAPLLLRPLLDGECEIENDFDVGGDDSLQLLQAAAAANHAQAIVITLLEEYNSIFGEGSVSPGPDLYTDSGDSGSESEEATDDDLSYDDYSDEEPDESIEESDVDAVDDLVSETHGETGDSPVNNEYDDKARKNLSLESIDCLIEYEAEIERLEDVKQKLQSEIAEEVKVNAKLQYDMETRKKALQERRLFLEQSVARLQEQLLKEKSSRATLEAGLSFSPGTLSELSGIDERTKADLGELVLIEADLANLEWKVNEIGLRLDAQLERSYGSTLDNCNQPQQITDHERNLKNKLETEVAATSESDRSTSKQDSFVEAENQNETKPESTPLLNKHSPSSKKYSTKSEGANAPSALTRLTSKLNFLKERREVPNELQLPLPSPNKSAGVDLSPNKSPSPNKSRGYDYYMGFLSPIRRRGSENRSPPEKGPSNMLRKSDSQHHSDRQDNEYSEIHLKRGNSESRYQSYNLDKGDF